MNDPARQGERAARRDNEETPQTAKRRLLDLIATLPEVECERLLDYATEVLQEDPLTEETCDGCGRRFPLSDLTPSSETMTEGGPTQGETRKVELHFCEDCQFSFRNQKYRTQGVFSFLQPSFGVTTMTTKRKLARDARGNIKRDLGPPPHQFYVGTDEVQGLARIVRLESLWTLVEARSGTWTPQDLEIGKALARGEETYKVQNHPNGVFVTAEKVADLQTRYPMIRVIAENDAETVQDRNKTVAGRLRREANIREYGRVEGLPFHAALTMYGEKSVKLEMREPGSAELTDAGQKVLDRLDFIKDHIVDFPMGSLNLAKVDEILAYFKNRPLSKRKTPCSRELWWDDGVHRSTTFSDWLRLSLRTDVEVLAKVPTRLAV